MTMTALPPQQMRAMRETAATAAPLSQRWESVHSKAQRVAAMADLAAEPVGDVFATFASRLTHAVPVQQALAERAVDDIDAMLDMGLKALDVVEARGQDASAPALALWREFYHAREAVLGALEPLAA